MQNTELFRIFPTTNVAKLQNAHLSKLQVELMCQIVLTSCKIKETFFFMCEHIFLVQKNSVEHFLFVQFFLSCDFFFLEEKILVKKNVVKKFLFKFFSVETIVTMKKLFFRRNILGDNFFLQNFFFVKFLFCLKKFLLKKLFWHTKFSGAKTFLVKKKFG